MTNPILSVLMGDLKGDDAPTDSSVTPTNLFVHHDSHPYVLARVLLKKFGPSWLSWDPDTLRNEIISEYKKTIHKQVWEKLRAVRSLFLSNGFWSRWEEFLPITMALNNSIPDFEMLQHPTVGQLMAAVDIAQLVRKDLTFGDDICRFVAACLHEDCLYYCPEPIAFAQEATAVMMYRCLDCGNTDEVDIYPIVCDVCVERFQDAHAFNQKASERGEKILMLGQGKNIDVYQQNPYQEVADRYAHLLSDDKARESLRDDNPVDVQVAKLLVARSYLEMRRKQMADQLRVVLGTGASDGQPPSKPALA